uniref:TSA: Wollemia nobilis Ref_Wollemi_Transcript_11948_1274 transcribed RNA sequence n=1 Tax=Wollemia nobilis TaxID=56998 RepID=A0A0C9QSE5_9CONI
MYFSHTPSSMEGNGNYSHVQTTSSPLPPACYGSSSCLAQNSSQNQLFQQRSHIPLQQGTAQSYLRSKEIQGQHLQRFWQKQRQDMEQISEFKQHQLPLARIKKIMKSDEEVKMISAEAPVLFSKACELFILELTLRSWLHTEENKRRTVQKNDIAGAIRRGDILDFLHDIVPTDDIKEEEYGGLWTGPSHVEYVPYGGVPFQFMNAQPYNQNLHPDIMAHTHTQPMPQQLMSQQPLAPEQKLYQHPQQ